MGGTGSIRVDLSDVTMSWSIRICWLPGCTQPATKNVSAGRSGQNCGSVVKVCAQCMLAPYPVSLFPAGAVHCVAM